MKPKAKVTLSLDAELVSAVDALAKRSAGRSRSSVVEEALRRWCEEQRYIELERQTEAYYRSLSESEREEDRQWAQIAGQQSGRLWD